jgi:hypothetical protein
MALLELWIIIFRTVFPLIVELLFILSNECKKIAHKSSNSVFENLIQYSQMLNVELNWNFLNDINRTIFIFLTQLFLLQNWSLLLFTSFLDYLSLLVLFFNVLYFIGYYPV